MRSYKPKMRRRGGGAGQLGMTLIEILVVLVILVFGILSVVRLFPGGFSVIRSTENNASAVRLGQSLLESLKQSAGSLPDAVYVGFMYNNGSPSIYAEYFDPDVRLDDLGPYTLKAGGVALYAGQYHDIDKARYISNETVTVPAPHSVNAVMMSRYLLNFAPIVMDIDPATASTSTLAPFLAVTSTLWTAKTADSTLVPPVDSSLSPPRMHPKDEPSEELHPGQPEYLVDYVNGRIAVPQYSDTAKTYDQYFIFTVKVNGVKYTLHLIVPKFASGTTSNTSAAYYGDWFSPGDATLQYELDTPSVALPASGWDDGSATLVRQFLYKPMATVTTDPFLGEVDPYEFTLPKTTMYVANTVANSPPTAVPISAIPNTRVSLGVVGFSPLAGGQNGIAPVAARISYSVYDWHIIHEDHDVPPSGEGTSVPLILKHIKKIGDVDKDSAQYTGLFDPIGTPNADNKFDLVVVDRDTGESFTNVYDLAEAVPPYSITDIGVSYQAGHLYFPDIIAKGHKHIRVFYAGRDDWAVALQKAPINYVRNDDPAAAMEMTRYYPPTNLFTQVQGTNPYSNVVSFPLCDAGLQVRFESITYTLKGTVSPANPTGTRVVKRGVLAPISLDVDPVSKLPYVNLASPELLSDMETSVVNPTPPGILNPVTISGVSGVSIEAVVIWRERDQWKRQAVDTIILPN